MGNKNYLMVENGVVTNVMVWDGDTNKWNPPVGAVMLVDEETPALVWDLNADKTEFVLIEVLGGGGIGFIWNGTALVTPEPKPEYVGLINQEIPSTKL